MILIDQLVDRNSIDLKSWNKTRAEGCRHRDHTTVRLVLLARTQARDVTESHTRKLAAALLIREKLSQHPCVRAPISEKRLRSTGSLIRPSTMLYRRTCIEIPVSLFLCRVKSQGEEARIPERVVSTSTLSPQETLPALRQAGARPACGTCDQALPSQQG